MKFKPEIVLKFSHVCLFLHLCCGDLSAIIVKCLEKIVKAILEKISDFWKMDGVLLVGLVCPKPRRVPRWQITEISKLDLSAILVSVAALLHN